MPPVASTSSTISTRVPGANGVGVHGQRLGAVLEVVGDRHHRPGQLAGLADRDEAGTEGERHRGREQEAAGLDAEHHVDVGRG